MSNCKAKVVGSLGADLFCTLLAAGSGTFVAQALVVHRLPNRVMTLLEKNVLCESQEAAKSMSGV